MPHSSVSITSYSWRALRFCAINRSLSCSRSGAVFFLGLAVTMLLVQIVLSNSLARGSGGAATGLRAPRAQLVQWTLESRRGSHRGLLPARRDALVMTVGCHRLKGRANLLLQASSTCSI